MFVPYCQLVSLIGNNLVILTIQSLDQNQLDTLLNLNLQLSQKQEEQVKVQRNISFNMSTLGLDTPQFFRFKSLIRIQKSQQINQMKSRIVNINIKRVAATFFKDGQLDILNKPRISFQMQDSDVKVMNTKWHEQNKFQPVWFENLNFNLDQNTPRDSNDVKKFEVRGFQKYLGDSRFAGRGQMVIPLTSEVNQTQVAEFQLEYQGKLKGLATVDYELS